MTRSTKDAWLTGPGDLREADVHDVPHPGLTVRVRGLSAKYSAEVQGKLKVVNEGREQVAKIDVAEMELLQFVHGCVDPTFNEFEARQIQAKFGPAFKKVVEKIDELSGIDKTAVEAVEQRFPAGGEDAPRGDLGDGTPARDSGPDLHVRVGA